MVSKPSTFNKLPKTSATTNDAIEYTVIKTVILKDEVFDSFCDNLSQETRMWHDKSGKSIGKGTENECVVIKAKKDKRKIIAVDPQGSSYAKNAGIPFIPQSE